MAYFLLILFSFLISIFSCTFLMNANNSKLDFNNISNFNLDKFNFSLFDSFDFSKNYLNISKYLILKRLKQEKNDFDEDLYKTLTDKEIRIFGNNKKERFNKSRHLSENNFNIKNKSELNIKNYINNLVNNINLTSSNYEYRLGNISVIPQLKYLNKKYNYSIKAEQNSFLKYKEISYSISFNISKFFDLAKKHFGSNSDKLISLCLEVMQFVPDYVRMAKALGNYFKANKALLPNIRNLLSDKEFKELLKESVHFNEKIFQSLFTILLERDEAIDLFIQVIMHDKLLDAGIEIYSTVRIPQEDYKTLPKFLGYLVEIDEALLMKFVRNALYVAGGVNGKEKFFNDSTKEIQYSIQKIFTNNMNVSSYNISENCMDFFKNVFLNDKNDGKWNKIIFKYAKKFIFDSPINKGDFMAYDNCLSESAEEVQDYNKNFSCYIKPVFAVGIVDNKNKTKYANTTYYEKYYYITNYCLPFGFIKNSTNDETAMCSDEDYNKILKFLFHFYSEDNDNITTLLLYDNKTNLDSNDYFKGILTIVILAIPIIIKIGLMISKFILDKTEKNNSKINKLIDEENEKNINKIQIYNENESFSTKKINFSKCQRLLNNYFSFYKNGKELFNFNLNNTNFNNVNGITYIKGLSGLSIILNVFGLTYTILMNIQMKDYGIWHFYSTMKNMLYIIIYIGYRYSPRVLFSCSGYTLTYKYLCFIEQDKGLYFLKFIFLQSYKYFFLYFILILFEYTILRVFYVFRKVKRPVWSLFEFFLNNEGFLKSAFALLFDFNIKNENNRQNLIYNFYMPINEIAFFLFGTILISIGYKFKLRIDLIIIVLIILFFIIKIIIYVLYLP